MIIELLNLKNFKPYRDSSIKFSTSKDKCITLFYGEMNAGKTSMFQAINWCLYGNYKTTDKDEEGNPVIIASENGKRILNRSEFDSLKEGQSIKVNVQLIFTDKLARYIATREATYIKEGDELVLNKEDFNISKSMPSGKPEKIEDHEREKIINSILPETVRDYFLFDGEKIDEFSRIGKEDELKEAVYQVLGLKVLNNAENYLDRAKNDFNKDTAGIKDKDIREGIERIKECETELNDEKKEYDNKKKELNLAKNEKEGIEGAYEKFSKISKDIEKRRELENNFNELFQKDKKFHDNLLEEIDSSGLILSKKLMEDTLKILEKTRAQKGIPFEYAESFINDLLHDLVCICKRPFKKGSKEWKAIEDELKSAPKSGEFKNEILNLTADLKSLMTKGSLTLKHMKAIQSNRSELRNEMEDCNNKIGEITEKIEKLGIEFSEEELLSLEEKRRDIRIKIDRLKHDLDVKEGIIIDKKNMLESAKKDLDRIKSKDEKDRVLKERIILAGECITAIQKLYETYAEDKRKEIDKLCKEIFMKLIWAKSQFKNVEFNKDYELHVLDRFNQPARPDLSAAQRELLSLSFITAMAFSAGKEAAFIIDTPFARISKTPTDNIAKTLPSMITQLILFVTDKELTKEAEQIYLKKAGKVYTLIFDDKRWVTEVVEGKHVK